MIFGAASWMSLESVFGTSFVVALIAFLVLLLFVPVLIFRDLRRFFKGGWRKLWDAV